MMHNYGNQFQLGTSARDTRAFFFGYEEIITMQIKKNFTCTAQSGYVIRLMGW